MESTDFRVSAAIKAQPPSSQSCAVQPAGPGYMTSAGEENNRKKCCTVVQVGL